ncbi:CPBP family intramembrane glutamic endopeptidase [Arthrobacter sp. Ld5]|uniref:CPBP family intramembrane glutamic endopeptidase n=1 Tax=Arthrobacter sp. Ld5 TaxID=649152 RepID=UPI003EBA41FC
MSTPHSPASILHTTAAPAAAVMALTGQCPRPSAGTDTATVLPYHRLARSYPSYRWWRPLLTLAVAAVTYGLLLLALVVAALIASAIDPALGAGIDAAMDPSALLDMNNPVAALLTLLMLAIGLPAALVGVRIGGWRPAGSVSSARGRLRWGLLARCLGMATGLHLMLTLGVTFTDMAFTGAGTAGATAIWTQRSGWMLAVAFLVVPFQAAAEEYVFRGVLMQTIGSWLRHPAWAILLPVPLFVLGHEYGWVAQVDIAVFAVAAGWLTWRTGGLEAAIGLHIIGNCLAFGFGAVGLTDLNATDIPPASVALSIGLTLTYTALITRRRTWWCVPAPGPHA